MGPQHRRVVATLAFLCLGHAAQAGGEECTGFVERVLATGGINGAETVFAADLDGDGDLDLIAGSSVDDTITWYRSNGSTGAIPLEFEARVITRSADSVSAVYAADVDADGDVDVLAATRGDATIAWYVNNGENPPVFTRRVVATNISVATDVIAADLNGAGGLDLLSTSFVNNKITWHRSDGNLPRVFLPTTVTTNARGASAVATADLDADGDLDVLSASILDDKIAWYESLPLPNPPSGPDPNPDLGFTEHVISTTADGATTLVAADLDGDVDGHVDVVAGSFLDSTIRWYENDGAGSFTAFTVSDAAAGPVSVAVADLDHDGLRDIVAALSEDGAIVWYRNLGRQPPLNELNFAAAQVVAAAPGANAVFVADIDGKNNLDVVSASSLRGFPSERDRVSWHENDGNSPAAAFTEHPVAVSSEGADGLAVGLIDDDDQPDIVAAAARSDMIAWFRNDGGVFTKQVVSANAPGARALAVADMDGDLDDDVVAALEETGSVTWYENLGGALPGFIERGISTAAPAVRAVRTADLDGDGDPDVIAAGQATVAIHESRPGMAGMPPTFVEHVLDDEAQGAVDVFAIDLDGDDDLDLLVATTENNTISWYVNDGAAPPAFPTFVRATDPVSQSASGVAALIAADLDGDEDADVIAAQPGSSRIAWYENDGQNPPTFIARIVSSSSAPQALLTRDLDADGDMDLVAVARGSNRVSWFENNGLGPPTFTEHVLQGNRLAPTSIAAADFNLDGRQDLAVGLLFEIQWYEEVDEVCVAFDANSDSVIDGTELAWIGRAFGQRSANPTSEWWFSVDFNADGTVDGDDLSILTSFGVWGRTTDTCVFSCR